MIISTILSFGIYANREDTPKQVFMSAMENYSKLNSISVDIENDGSSGLFPGKFSQHIDFVRSKGFRIVMELEKGQIRPEGSPPDYYCDGKDVTTVGTNAGVKPLNTDPNLTPGYEVASGIMSAWLLDSPTKKLFTSPPEGFSIEVSRGTKKEWRGDKVSNLVFTIQSPGAPANQKADIFLSTDEKKLIGFEWTANGKLGYMHYRNEKDNPTIDLKTFKPPK